MKPAYPIAYRDEIVETQGKLFGRFQCDYPDADGEDFITAYLCGETRSRIDNAAAILSNMTPAELQDEFMTQEGYRIQAGHPIDPFAADWIGQFFAYYQWQTGERSRDIINRIPTQVMCAAYPGLHNLDLPLAVERINGSIKIGSMKEEIHLPENFDQVFEALDGQVASLFTGAAS